MHDKEQVLTCKKYDFGSKERSSPSPLLLYSQLTEVMRAIITQCAFPRSPVPPTISFTL